MDRFDKLVEDMGKHAQLEYPRECCGVILNDLSYVPAENKSLQPKTSFVLDPGILVKYDEQIWGIFHSHPGEDQPIPSRDDKYAAGFSQYKFIVGFGKKFYIYWQDKEIDALKFDKFQRNHLY